MRWPVRSDGYEGSVRVENLTVEFGVHEGILRAGRTMSVLRSRTEGTSGPGGRRGPGKSVCSQAIMGLLAADRPPSRRLILSRIADQQGSPIDIAKLDRAGRRCATIRGGAIRYLTEHDSLSALHLWRPERRGGRAACSAAASSDSHFLGRQDQEAVNRSGRKLSRRDREMTHRHAATMVGFRDPRGGWRTSVRAPALATGA